MNRAIKFGLMSLLAIGAFVLPGALKVSAQAAQDFTLVNKTGVEIYALYISPVSSNDWGSDILGVDTLLPNGTVDISFSRREKARLWDLRIEDSSGDFVVWEALNLTQIDTLTLFYEKGKPTATWIEKDWDLRGNWVGYYSDGTRSPYVWKITQNGQAITITATKGGRATSRGTIRGSRVFAMDFATQDGVVSEDGMNIVWTDGVVWRRQ